MKTKEVTNVINPNGHKLAEMNLTLRRGRVEDAQICGLICYEAFKAIADQHNYPPDFPY